MGREREESEPGRWQHWLGGELGEAMGSGQISAGPERLAMDRILGAGEVNAHPSCLECLEEQSSQALSSPQDSGGERDSAFDGLSLVQSDLAEFQFRKTIQ